MANKPVKFENLDDLGCIELTATEAASFQGGMIALDPNSPTIPTDPSWFIPCRNTPLPKPDENGLVKLPWCAVIL